MQVLCGETPKNISSDLFGFPASQAQTTKVNKIHPAKVQGINECRRKPSGKLGASGLSGGILKPVYLAASSEGERRKQVNRSNK